MKTQTKYSRAERLSDLIRSEISEIILRKIKDPRVQMITITGVDLSEDLRIAKVFFTTMAQGEERQTSIAGLKSAAGFIRKTLGSRLDLRYVPEINFFYDESFEYGARIDKLIKKVKEEGNEVT